MPKDIWKQFGNNKLSHSAADYLMTIKELLLDQGYTRVTDVAKRFNITRGSCCISLKPLKKRSLVVEDQNKFLQLSDEGERLVDMVARNDERLEAMFHEILGVDQEQAAVGACKIEHLLSIPTSMCLAVFIDYIKSDRVPVQALRKDMRSHFTTCTHGSENCPICNNVCCLKDAQVDTE